MANGPGYTVDAGTVVLTFDSVDALAAGQFLAAQIKAQSQSGQLVNTTYVNGASSPGGTNLLTVLSRPTTPTGFINLDGLTFTDHNVITVVPGYTDVVASVPDLMGLSQIAVGSRIILSDGGGLNVTGLNSGADGVVYVVAGNGNNSIFTAPNYPLSGTNTFVLSPPGHYFVATGSGDDEINIGTGSGTVEPGGGHNEVKLVGNSIVISNGYDSIVGNTVPLGQSGSGGTDTIAVGAGQTTINPGSSSFLVNDGSSNVFSLFRGAGSDTVYLGGLGGGTVQGGLAGNNLLVGGIGGTASAPIVLQGGGDGRPSWWRRVAARSPCWVGPATKRSTAVSRCRKAIFSRPEWATRRWWPVVAPTRSPAPWVRERRWSCRARDPAPPSALCWAQAVVRTPSRG